MFRIRKSQERIVECTLNNVEANLFAHIREEFPEQLIDIDASKLREMIKMQVQHVLSHGIESREVLRVIDIVWRISGKMSATDRQVDEILQSRKTSRDKTLDLEKMAMHELSKQSRGD